MSGRESIDVETLLQWAYQRENADAAGADSALLLGMLSAAGGNGERMAEVGAAGCMISGTRGMRLRDRLHEDAYAVAQTVEEVCGRQSRFVIGHAKAGTRPDWMPNARPRWEPVLDKGTARRIADSIGDVLATVRREPARDGFPEHYSVRIKDRNRHVIRSWWPVRLRDVPAFILARRRLYGLWWELVNAICYRLQRADNLTKHEVTGFAAPLSPWPREEYQKLLEWEALDKRLNEVFDNCAKT